MYSLEDIEKSQKQYVEAKAYFMSLNLPDCVIEILDASMSTWPIHLTPTEELANEKCRELRVNKKRYLIIYSSAGDSFISYRDGVINVYELVTKNIIIDSDLVENDEDLPKQELDEKQVAKEFRALVKQLLEPITYH